MEDKITLNGLIAEDSGMYQARAFNQAGEASFSLELVVLSQGQFMNCHLFVFFENAKCKNLSQNNMYKTDSCVIWIKRLTMT